jgi:hypothetical protein
MKDAILAKLAEIEAMLLDASCDGESFGENLQDFDSWAGEVDLAVRTLAEKIEYYID